MATDSIDFFNKITFEFVSIHLSIHVDSFSFRSRLILYH